MEVLDSLLESFPYPREVLTLAKQPMKIGESAWRAQSFTTLEKALSPPHLLRLAQADFYALMSEHPDHHPGDQPRALRDGAPGQRRAGPGEMFRGITRWRESPPFPLLASTDDTMRLVGPEIGSR